MDSNDDNLVETKTLIEFNQSTTETLALKEESRKLDLTSSTTMGARITKSQENGSGVVGEENGSVTGGGGVAGVGGGGDCMNGPGNLKTREIVRVEVEENVADGGGGEKVVKENDGNLDAIPMENNANGYSDRKSFGDASDSIAQRTRNRAVAGKEEGVDVENGHSGNKSGDEVDGESGFSVGDFVWGKIKSHPWWPGRLYDPSDASQFALKYKHEGRLLVGYFGDRTFAWCDPSQLISFEENFEDMSNQSSQKTFVSAVEEAVNEIGRLVKIQMTYSSARESQSSLPLVVNAGVKEGVCVPKNGLSIFTLAQFKPFEVLAEVKRLATLGTVSNALELTVLKNRLSAFYHAKYGYSLPIHCDPIGIEGLVDYQGVLAGDSIRGPDDEELFMGPEDRPLGKNEPKTSLDFSQKKRKVKSIVELLGSNTENELVGNVDRTVGEAQSEHSVRKYKKRRRKVSDEDQSSVQAVTGDEISSKDEEQSGTSVPESGRKRRKTIDKIQSPGGDDGLMITRSSSRKKKDGSARSTISEKKASGQKEARGSSGKVKDKLKKSKVPHVSVSDGSKVEEGYERISPRERKVSKYLSPPYTNLLQRQRSSCSQTGSEAGGLVFSDVSRMGDRMAKTASKLTGSPPLVKCSAETFRKSSKVSDSKHEKTDMSDRNTSKSDPSSEVSDPLKSIGSLNSVLDGIRSAALDVVYPKKNEAFDSVRGFVSSYRSSNYKNGPNYSSYKKTLTAERRKKRKRNSSVSEHEPDQKGSDQVDLQTPDQKSMKRKSARNREQKLESKASHEVRPSSLATLVIAFPVDFSIPAKKDIIEMCSEFGDVDEAKSDVVPESMTAKIVFVQSSGAEAAMDSMQKSVPFGSVKVSYKIENLVAASSKGKQVNVQNKKKIKSPETRVAAAELPEKLAAVSPTPESEPLTVIIIKQKLEAMSSMLSQTDGKMTQEVKVKLKKEAKDLLKKVKTMTAAPSSS